MNSTAYTIKRYIYLVKFYEVTWKIFTTNLINSLTESVTYTLWPGKNI